MPNVVTQSYEDWVVAVRNKLDDAVRLLDLPKQNWTIYGAGGISHQYTDEEVNSVIAQLDQIKADVIQLSTVLPPPQDIQRPVEVEVPGEPVIEDPEIPGAP